ncbi:MAG: hypothetical protein ABI651_18665 [Verrucomicrobiota bacterium]
MKRVPQIELDTPIVPSAVMKAVCEEAGVWLGQPLPRRWISELTAHANTTYAHNARFRRNVRAKGDKGRDYLWAFVRHWLAGLLGKRRPQLHARLPVSYSIGHPLPQKWSGLTRRPDRVGRAPPAPRLRPRLAPNHAYAAAAHFHFA